MELVLDWDYIDLLVCRNLMSDLVIFDLKWVELKNWYFLVIIYEYFFNIIYQNYTCMVEFNPRKLLSFEWEVFVYYDFKYEPFLFYFELEDKSLGVLYVKGLISSKEVNVIDWIELWLNYVAFDKYYYRHRAARPPR